MQIGSIIENWVATWNIKSWRLEFDLDTLFERTTALCCTFQSFMFQAELGGERIAESVALLLAYRTPSTSNSHWNANIELLYNYDQSHDLIINWIPWPYCLVCTPPLVSVHSAAICISTCTWGLGFDHWDVWLLFTYLMLFFFEKFRKFDDTLLQSTRSCEMPVSQTHYYMCVLCSNEMHNAKLIKENYKTEVIKWYSLYCRNNFTVLILC